MQKDRNVWKDTQTGLMEEQSDGRSQATRWSDDHRKYSSWQRHTDINDTSHLGAWRRAAVCVRVHI